MNQIPTHYGVGLFMCLILWSSFKICLKKNICPIQNAMNKNLNIVKIVINFIYNINYTLIKSCIISSIYRICRINICFWPTCFYIYYFYHLNQNVNCDYASRFSLTTINSLYSKYSDIFIMKIIIFKWIIWKK